MKKKNITESLSILIISALFFTPISVVTIVATAENSFAANLDSTRFSREKVTSVYKANATTSYAACYTTGGTCTVQRSSTNEWTLPSGGYFKLVKVNGSSPWQVQACSFGGSCSSVSDNGKIFAFKSGNFLLYRGTNSANNWVFSMSFLSPYSWALGADISWSFDGPGTGHEGEYKEKPSSITSSINGETTVGSTLSAVSTYVAVDGDVSYQWKRSSSTSSSSFSNITGAINNQYTLTNDDGGKYIKVTVTVTNVFGNDSATSNYLKIDVPPAELDSTFGSVTSTLGGFTVNVTNYDANYNYSAASSSGVVAIGVASGRNLPLTVTGLTSSQNATVTVTTTRRGATDGSGTVSGTSSASAITTATGPVGRWVANSISRDGNTFLVANQEGSIYRSTDSGVNWQQLTAIQNWSSVAQSNNGTKIVGAVAGGKIHVSTNSGATWSEVASAQNWRSIACNADCSTIIAAVAGGKLWRSTNTGSTWNEVGETQSWRAVAVSDDGTKMIAVPFNGSVVHSENSGATWATEQSQRVLPQWTSVAMNGDGSKMYAAFLSGLLQVSTDFGNTWGVQIFTGDNTSIAIARDSGALIQCGSNGRINYSSAIGETIGLVAANPTPWSACSVSGDGNKIMGSSTTGLIYISTNGGNTWREASQQTGNVKRRALVSSENGAEVFSAIYGGGIEYSSNSGSTWSVANATQQNWIGMAASNSMQKIFAVAYNGQINRSTDSGATWEQVESVRPWISVACSSDGSKVIAAAQGGLLYVSTDSGATWTARATKRKWVSVATSSDGAKLVAAVQGGFIYTSTNSGVSWTERAASRNWSAVASSSSGTKLVATVAQGRIYVSSDSGATWQAKASTRNWLNVASSTSGTRLLAAVGTGQIFYSRDSGSTWSAADSARNWRALYLTGSGTRAYAADFGKKLYRSSDSGENWTAL